MKSVVRISLVVAALVLAGLWTLAALGTWWLLEAMADRFNQALFTSDRQQSALTRPRDTSCCLV